MLCYHPITIRSPDPIRVPCGQCFACQSNRRKEFAFRIKEEMKHSVCSYTVTLTYDDFNIPSLVAYNPVNNDTNSDIYPDSKFENVYEESEFCSPDSFYFHPFDLTHVQKYLKVLRKTYKFRYFGVAEYGGKTARPHYHIIFFFKTPVLQKDFEVLVRKKWSYGIEITVDRTTDKCIEYTLKYCLKPKYIKQPSPKVFCSKNPFIGYSYFTWDRLQFHLHNHNDMTLQNGVPCRLPRIYRRIYENHSSRLDENAEYWNRQIENFETVEHQEAFYKGLSVGELRNQKQLDHTNRCLKQISKKSL